eukprot:SAG22_NODE_18581_length_284_cov_5.016216_1_plen_52_part_10
MTERHGPAHAVTLTAKGDMANLVKQTGERARARRLYAEVVAGQTEQLGPAHN